MHDLPERLTPELVLVCRELAQFDPTIPMEVDERPAYVEPPALVDGHEPAGERKRPFRRRVHALLAAGIVDSFGLALGWTVFNLYAFATQGLGALGAYNAAMLVGVALSAPATDFLCTRLDGRRLLQTTAVVEAAFRVGTFVLLLRHAPIAVIAVAVAVTNILAWTGYAGMRAEVAAVDRRAAAMTWYVVCIASIEAAGAAAGALLPVGSQGTVAGALLVAVIVWYGASLLPTLFVARGARVTRSAHRRERDGPPTARPVASLVGGFAVMALASGPTLLSVGLAAEFHGRSWVAAAAVAFTAGSLVSPVLAGAVERSTLPPSATWPLLGVGMIAGWIVAPWHAAGLLVAQCLAGLCMTTLEGTMDARVASTRADDRVTAGLAWTASARALGSSVAVGAVPMVIAFSALETVSAVSALLLASVSFAAMAAPTLGATLFGRQGLRSRDVRPASAP